MKSSKRPSPSEKTAILTPGHAMQLMRQLVEALNRDHAMKPFSAGDKKYEWRSFDVSATKRELRRLISLWDEAGRNLRVLFSSQTDLFDRCAEGKTYLVLNREDEAQIAWSPALAGDFKSPELRGAWEAFVYLLVNPFAKKLAGPCPRCDCYWIREYAHNTKYCSRKCSSRKTAETATQKRRRIEAEEKLHYATQLIWEYESLRNKGRLKHISWSEYLLKKPQFKKKWITQKLKAGLLIAPF